MEFDTTAESFLFFPDECEALGMDRILGQWPVSHMEDLMVQIAVRRRELAHSPALVEQAQLKTLGSIADQLGLPGE